MSETKRKLRNSKQTDLTELSEGAFVTLSFHICHAGDSSVSKLECTRLHTRGTSLHKYMTYTAVLDRTVASTKQHMLSRAVSRLVEVYIVILHQKQQSCCRPRQQEKKVPSRQGCCQQAKKRQ